MIEATGSFKVNKSTFDRIIKKWKIPIINLYFNTLFSVTDDLEFKTNKKVYTSFNSIINMLDFIEIKCMERSNRKVNNIFKKKMEHFTDWTVICVCVCVCVWICDYSGDLTSELS